MKMIKDFLFFLWDIFVPRFVTENCAILHLPDGPVIVCREVDLIPEDIYDEIVEIKSFNFFGMGLFPRMTNKKVK